MYFVEGYDFAPAQWGTINAKPCTLSFWFKTNMGGQHYVTVCSSSGIDTWSTSIRSTMNVWEHHVITVPPPMTGTWNYTNGRGIEIRIGLMRTGSVTVSKSGQWFHGGTGYNGFAEAHSDWPFNTAHAAYLTGVQFEIGSQATPFEHRSFGDELERCRRYFQIIKGGSDDYTGLSGYSESTSNARFPVYFRPPMRSDPTLGVSGTLRFQGGTNDSATFTSGLALQQINSTFDGASMQLTGSSGMGAADRPGNLQFKASNSSLSFDAEL